jgi:hypothetical protein
MFEQDPVCHIGDYYQKLPFLLNSPLYECLDFMPKPAVHHIHLTAAVKIDYLVHKILYYDFVYFNQKEGLFKVNRRGVDEPGYVKVNELRQFWESSTKFDEYMRNIILLPKEVLEI